MLPSLALHYSTDQCRVDTELARKRNPCPAHLRIAAAYLAHVFLFQLGLCLGFASAQALRVKFARMAITARQPLRVLMVRVAFTATMSLLLLSVRHVVVVCPQEQVSRVTAAWVIAGVADKQLTGVGAVRQEVCDPVRRDTTLRRARPSNRDSVPEAGGGAKPRPAVGVRPAQNFAPESGGLLWGVSRENKMLDGHAICAPFTKGVVRLERCYRTVRAAFTLLQNACARRCQYAGA